MKIVTAVTEGVDGTWTSTLGWTSHPDGKRVSFHDCHEGAIDFAGVTGQRIALTVSDEILTAISG